MTCDFKKCGILTSVDSDKPVQSPVKLRNSKCCSISSLQLLNIQAPIRLHVCSVVVDFLT